MTTATAHPSQNWLLLVLRLRTFVALILVLAYFSIMAPNFLTAANAVIVSKHVALNAFLAIDHGGSLKAAARSR